MYIPFEAVFPNGPLMGIRSKAPEKISERNRDTIDTNSDSISVPMESPSQITLRGAFFLITVFSNLLKYYLFLLNEGPFIARNIKWLQFF